jgi:phospholipase/carboxylesterase
MPSSALQSIQLQTGNKPTHCVIWLHGLGADGHDFEPIVAELNLPSTLQIRFIFPHAPVRPITLNGGMQMRGWYDLKSLQLDRSKQDPEGVIESSLQIQAIIQEQISQGIAAKNIIIAGFSQGGAIALFTGLTGSVKLGGILALSTYLPLAADQSASLNKDYNDLPIFMAHGKFDDVVQPKYAQMSRDLMQSQGFNVEWHEYNVAHSLDAQEICDISQWLQKTLGQ